MYLYFGLLCASFDGLAAAYGDTGYFGLFLIEYMKIELHTIPGVYFGRKGEMIDKGFDTISQGQSHTQIISVQNNMLQLQNTILVYI